MKKRILLEAALSELDKVQMNEDGTRMINFGACKVDKLIRYYKLALEHNLKNTRFSIEAEFDNRGLREFIVPMKELTAPVPRAYSLELMQKVVDAKGDIEPILREAHKSFDFSGLIVKAYVIALTIGESGLADGLMAFIKSIGTYTRYMPRYLELCQLNTGMPEKLAELTRDAESYRSW